MQDAVLKQLIHNNFKRKRLVLPLEEEFADLNLYYGKSKKEFMATDSVIKILFNKNI